MNVGMAPVFCFQDYSIDADSRHCLMIIFYQDTSYFLFLKTSNEADLRDDKQFFIDHPGAVPITTAQVMFSSSVLFISVLCFPLYVRFISLPFQGEELRKLIGAPAYIECSSKTQQVFEIWTCNCNM